MTETETSRSGTEGFDAPPLRRLRYFHGQMLGARDFQREQDYHREKLKLRLRALLGYGVVCGLHVEPAPRDEDDCPPDSGEETPSAGQSDAETPRHTRRRAKVTISPGLGVDCDGNEVVVRGGCAIDLWKALPPHERDTDTVWVGIEYAERPVEPTRAVYNDACADTSDCEFGWTEECYTVRVTGCEPPADERCDTCCSSCEHTVLWLARIDCVDWYEPVRRHQIHMNVRRPFGRHVPTVITGINWIHGHTYTIDEAKALLGTQDEDGGLVVRFSSGVRTDTLRPGVVEVQVIEGGSGRNASTWYMGGRFADPDLETDSETVGGCGEFTQEFRYRQTTRETLQDGDRVLITVRAAFLLDRCCRPVDGTHVGGRVPTIDDHTTRSAAHGGCDLPPSGIGPWTSGTGAGGDVFESWFFVKER
ncbi:hypothetical protein [Streptomyces botrytidirepellens]|uniref:Uncharacterized protein n=1 Tax=Streptomyces botrytidirepellens TaxID=2486417 RepID=A0A3M8VT70_9ACTN|nr:hypothetical protein [Streptomyces botrytidirepellens]RNG19621.1 hypothetical protein EEJ42_24575 [Streptomyces botrytidirepellens]